MGADVGGLVGHDAGKFGLFVSGHDEAGVDVEEAAGKGHGVDLVRVDDLDGEGDLAIGVLDDVLTDAVDVFDDDGVGDEVGGLLDLHRVGLADADLPVGGVPVADAATADVAVAYGVDVIFAAGLDVGIKGFTGGWERVRLILGVCLLGGFLELLLGGLGVSRRGLIGGGVGGDLGGGDGLVCRSGARGCGRRLRLDWVGAEFGGRRRGIEAEMSSGAGVESESRRRRRA